MTTKDEALRMALERCGSDSYALEQKAVIACREALAQPAGERGELIRKAMWKAYHLGQIYWQQADSEFTSRHKKADATHTKFIDLVEETAALLSSDAQPSEWVGLTEDEANALWESTDSDWELMKRTEKFLREKNAGKPAAENTRKQDRWDDVPQDFRDWWNGDYDDSTNPFRLNSAAYWAWAGWKAAEDKAGGDEPVAWMWRCKPYCNWPEWSVSLKRPADSGCDGNKRTEGYEDVPLYTRPQPQADIDPRWAGVDFEAVNADIRSYQQQIARLRELIQPPEADADGYVEYKERPDIQADEPVALAGLTKDETWTRCCAEWRGKCDTAIDCYTRPQPQADEPVAKVDYNERGNIRWLFGPQVPDGTELFTRPQPQGDKP